MKKLLAAIFSSVGEIAAYLETDPAILSVMPQEMTSFQMRVPRVSTFEDKRL